MILYDMKPSSYEALRLKNIEENKKRINALKKINKDERSKPKLKAQDKCGKSNSKYELPNARSSYELARIFNIKRENVASNIEKLNVHVAGNRENVSNQNKLPNTNVVKSNATRLDRNPRSQKAFV